VDVLVTSSARKAAAALFKGRRVDVWNNNARIDIVYQPEGLDFYITKEKDHIGIQQKLAEVRNARRRL
jgi:hypothetical protein